jgi:pyruvate,water dikinase
VTSAVAELSVEGRTAEVSDDNCPVHTVSAPGTRWSRVNFAEAIQGVQTPLGWTFWDLVMETSVRRAFGAIGALPGRAVPPPDSPDEKISAAFFGLPAGNVTTFHRLGQAMPGTSGDAVVEQMFGECRPAGSTGRAVHAGLARYPVVAVKMPVAVIRSSRRIRRMRDELRRWWRSAVIELPPVTVAAATELLRDSAQRFVAVGEVHTTLSMVGQACAEQVEALAETAWGSREGAADLMTGYGGLEETEIMADLCSMAGGTLGMEEFLARHGYHGPDEGNLASTMWREDPKPVQRLAERYRSAEVEHPGVREAAQQRRRADAERRLLAALSPPGRAKAKIVLRLAELLIPMRELGKASFLHSLDGARSAARILGEHLVRAGLLDDREDVFFLTYAELLAGVTEPAQPVVALRKADHRRFQSLAVPPAWTGNPEPVAESPGQAAARVAEPVSGLRGIGVVGDEVTGRARVVLDPAEADLDPGDILVCRTTDPSWTPLFLVAEALVIDTGGAMSHGAIVARELGVTCVINTGTGTRDIPDGATITVNGRTGQVDIS